MKGHYYYSSIGELSGLVRTQQTSPAEVVDAFLKRIRELNPKLNAYITVSADHAIEDARAAEAEIRAGRWRGPLHGLPIGVKDFYDTAGIKTTAAFEHFEDRVPTRDAAGVARLKAAGAIIIGKTNMHRLGTGTTGLDSYFGPVRNPWNAEFIPGGSSSGSAAAVASGMCCATLDTDAVGSCRLPAACCGVVGFKGTYGLISAKGILEGEEPPDETILWLSHPGITARTVADIALVLDVLAERNEHDNAPGFFERLAEKRRLRVGAARNFKGHRAVTAAFVRAMETIDSLGYPISGVAAPFVDLRRGTRSIEADRKAIAGRAFKDIDVLVLPTTTAAVPTVTDAGDNPLALSPENTAFANYYGLPAISVPCGFDASGLPLGLQIVGKPWDEGTVLHLAHQFQEATDYSNRHPPV